MNTDWRESRRVITEWYHEMMGNVARGRQQWVHCDDLICHAPQKCEYCDEFGADLQQRRIEINMNFTGETDPGKWPDPATMSRPEDIINRWPGNYPKK